MMPSGASLCNICGEQLVLSENGELFVACHECSYPICKACFEHEINEGHKVCLKCGTPYEGNLFYVYITIFQCKRLLFVYLYMWVCNSFYTPNFNLHVMVSRLCLLYEMIVFVFSFYNTIIFITFKIPI